MDVGVRTVNPIRKHRRDVWLKIILPVVLPMIGLLVLIGALIAAAANDTIGSKQITIIMSILATCFLSLPAVLLCLVPYALLAGTAILAGKGYEHAQTPVRFLRRLSERIAFATNVWSPRLARPVMALNVNLTRWEKTLNSWLKLDGDKE
jgi:hypothetical protein